MMTIAQEQRVLEFKKMRQTLGLTQAQLGERLNMPGLTSTQMTNLISCWETKKKPIPDGCFGSLQRLFNDNILAEKKSITELQPYKFFTRDGLMFRTWPSQEIAESHASVIVKDTGRSVEIGELVTTHLVEPQVVIKVMPIHEVVTRNAVNATISEETKIKSDLYEQSDIDDMTQSDDDKCSVHDHLHFMLPD
jgi:transcriptional regulator with XRE-family HTH domain